MKQVEINGKVLIVCGIMSIVLWNKIFQAISALPPAPLPPPPSPPTKKKKKLLPCAYGPFTITVE